MNSGERLIRAKEVQEKCCAHCPGIRWSSSLKDRRDEHSCGLPAYVRGNLKLSSLRKLRPGPGERPDEPREGSPAGEHQPDRPSSCYDRFAIAKKFHSENLQHRPLPDRVDDTVFKNFRSSDGDENDRVRGLNRLFRPFGGANDGTRREPAARFSRKIRANIRYGPTLGCKTPTTNMDLAICWEAPLDRAYEPPRAVHIDGTDGGPAPAIFALVEHEIPRRAVERRDSRGCPESAVRSYEAKFSNVGGNRCRCAFAAPQECAETVEKRDADRDLCDELGSINISDEAGSSGDGITNATRSADAPIKKNQAPHLRNCSSCECKGERAARKPRGRISVRSACAPTRDTRRNGLPTKLNVPRPKTPYAKRSFCIDTLTPPFSVINGCRDADYPEHWRLTSVYRQSYRNPRKQRDTLINCH